MANDSTIRRIALLGSTGSIGKNVLAVIAQNRQLFQLVSMAAGQNMSLFTQQIQEFSPKVVSVKIKEDARRLQRLFPHIKIYWGKDGLKEVVMAFGVNTTVCAISGTEGLEAMVLAIKECHRLCVANKEIMVSAGELINQELKHSQAHILPIDSEQSAIFQCLGYNERQFLKKVILTASGGPFFQRPKDDFRSLKIEEALAHPTWLMGEKITIDSATLINKALEIIEAYHLFNLDKDQIDVIIHPQSIIHSMVEFIDSSIIAQLSQPDMKIPILYSFTYPLRLSVAQYHLDLTQLNKLEFYPVDKDKFPSINMAYRVLERGGNCGAIFNTANEVAVEYFLKGLITFEQIFSVVENMLNNETICPINSYDDVIETIKHTRAKTDIHIKKGVAVC